VSEKVSRRRFLVAAAKGVSLGLAAPYLMTSNALAAGSPPSDRLGMGNIGVGGMGSGHHGRFANNDRFPCLAVADVDEGHRVNAAKRCKEQVGCYNDYRELLDRKDIDAVVIATPDHWHGLMTIHACEAGKDVYSEKPMMVTVAEGQAMVRAARRFGRIVQIGTQGRSTRDARCAAQFIRGGHIGKVHTVKTWHYNNPTHPNAPGQPVPRGLDWDLWLGPRKWRPYHSDACHFNFRWFLDSGGGQIRDRGAHIFSCICWAMNVDQTGPVSVEAKGTTPKGMYDVPTALDVKYEFKNPDWTLFWLQPGENFGGAGFGMKYFGTNGELVVNGGDSSIQADRKVFIDYPADQRLYESGDHMGNFLDCVRTRKAPIMEAAIAHRVTTLCALGNISYVVGRRIQWDPVAEQIVGDEEANRLLAPPFRAPWHL